MIDLIIVGEPFPYMKKSIPKYANVIIEQFDMDTGYNAALNRGASKGNANIIGFCNNDLVFDKDAIPKLIKALSKYDSVSGWCNLTHSEWWNEIQPYNEVVGYAPGKIVAGWCFFMTRKAYNRIGKFDERLKFWCSENIMIEQFKKKRIHHALIPVAIVNHKQSQTLNKLPKDQYEKMTRDQINLFTKITGFSPFNQK